jgi:hypothetical protein
MFILEEVNQNHQLAAMAIQNYFPPPLSPHNVQANSSNSCPPHQVTRAHPGVVLFTASISASIA